MVYEVETNRLIHLFTPLFLGWTISLIVNKNGDTATKHRQFLSLVIIYVLFIINS